MKNNLTAAVVAERLWGDAWVNDIKANLMEHMCKLIAWGVPAAALPGWCGKGQGALPYITWTFQQRIYIFFKNPTVRVTIKGQVHNNLYSFPLKLLLPLPPTQYFTSSLEHSY